MKPYILATLYWIEAITFMGGGDVVQRNLVKMILLATKHTEINYDVLYTDIACLGYLIMLLHFCQNGYQYSGSSTSPKAICCVDYIGDTFLYIIPGRKNLYIYCCVKMESY